MTNGCTPSLLNNALTSEEYLQKNNDLISKCFQQAKENPNQEKGHKWNRKRKKKKKHYKYKDEMDEIWTHEHHVLE